MKKTVSALLLLTMLFSFSITALSAGNPNIDSGGSGMGQGSSQNSWTSGRDGVRITIIRDSDNKPVSKPIDFSNQTNRDISAHFGKVSKLSYCKGVALVSHTGEYMCYKPVNAMPRIIRSGSGGASIDAIRDYFCREGTLRDIAKATGFSYENLISGNYKLLLEPIAYLKYANIMFAMTATEAALYNRQTGNDLRRKMVSLTHKNLPLAMFLETSDLGFPAWDGPVTQAQNDDTIIASLGLGIVRFSEPDPEPEKESDMTYRCDTEVITSVLLTTDTEKTPEGPAYADFSINGHTYSHKDIYIPEGESQLAWVKWKTPKEPGVVTIRIRSDCSLSTNRIVAKIVDMDQNPPPDPQANDRNDDFRRPMIPSASDTSALTWGEWDCWWHAHWVWHSGDGEDDGYWCDHGWWEYEWDSYQAELSAVMKTMPDEKNPTALGTEMKSGYGINANVNAKVLSLAPSGHFTGAQNVVAYFPEFNYQTYWRLLEQVDAVGSDSIFTFRKNPYSTYQSPVHFTPVWFPDGNYVIYAEVMDAWTPAGMLQVNLTDTLTVKDSLFADWHIRPAE